MALDLHILVNGRIGKRILAIDEEMFDQLISCFEIVQRKSGISVDQYAETKLPWRSYGAILTAIAEVRPDGPTPAATAALDKLEAALTELDAAQMGAAFVGD